MAIIDFFCHAFTFFSTFRDGGMSFPVLVVWGVHRSVEFSDK